MRSLDAGTSSTLEGAFFGLGLKTPAWLMIPLALLVSELLSLPLDYVANLFAPHDQMGGPGLASHGIAYAWILGCVIAPLAETAFNQWGCITLLRRVFGVGPWVSIVISAALFAAMHCYSWKYVLTVFPIGLVFSYVFVVEHARQGRPFAVVATVHALRNAISIGLMLHMS